MVSAASNISISSFSFTGLTAPGAPLEGLSADVLRVAFCIVTSFPLSSIFKRIPHTLPKFREAFILSIGVYYLIGIFHLTLGTLKLMGCALFTYVFAHVAASHRYMPQVNFVIQMTLMMMTHIGEQFSGGDYINNIGISGSQMILVQKLTSYAWDVHDGTRSITELSSQQQLDRLVAGQRPSFLRYLSWCFFFPTVLTGPFETFAGYNSWLDNLREFSTPITPELRSSQRRALAAKLGEGSFWVILYTLAGTITGDSRFYTRTWYLERGIFGRIAVLYVVGVAFRTKYYAAWLLSEAACIHSGLGFNGPGSGKNAKKGGLWDRTHNVSPWVVETAQSYHALFGQWNILTSWWLRNYVYVRVTPAGMKPGVRSTFLTFLTSAIWHGTRPGYYLTFILGAAYQTFGRVFRHTIRPVFVGSRLKPLYDIVSVIVVQSTLCFGAIPFILLDLRPAFEAWNSVYYYPLIGMAVSWLLLLGPLKAIVRPQLRRLSRDVHHSGAPQSK